MNWKKKKFYILFIIIFFWNGLGNDEMIIGVFTLVIETDKEKWNIIYNYYIIYI